MKLRRISLYSIFVFFAVGSVSFVAPSWAQTVTLRGFVTDQSDGQALQGVNVALQDEEGFLLGGITDSDGIFVITPIPLGLYRLQASFIGFNTIRDTLSFSQAGTQTLNFSMVPDTTQLGEVVVETEREGGAALLSPGLQAVRPADIDLIPTPDISGDLVAYLSTMPGVISIGDRGGQLFIRGGEPSHNLALLDGMYIYQPFHILGFYSAFASDIMNSADIYAGGFGSQYSGRISSVIDVRTRNGNKKEYRRTLSLAPFVNMAILEGPLIKDRVSFLASGRQSVIDRLASKYVNQPLPYKFGDFFGKVHAILGENHQLSLSAIRTYDRGSLTGQETVDATDEIRWTNTAYGGRYVILPQTLPVLGEILFSISQLDTEYGPGENPTRKSSISSFNAAVNITHYSGLSQVNWGFFLRSPETTSYLGGEFQSTLRDHDRSTNVGAYFEPDVYLMPSFHARIGLVTQVVGNKGFFVEPRMRLIWELGRHQWSAAFGIYNQEITGLTDRRDATNIFTAWTDTPTGSISRALHVLLGYSANPTDWLSLSVEGFYKKLSNLFIAEWTAYPRFTTKQQNASGHVAGLDLRVEIQRPTFYAFINYGLSSVEYEARQQSLLLWFGQETMTFRPPHDRRHQVNALIRTTIHGFDLSLRWNFGSGLPYNQIKGFDGFLLMDGAVDVSRESGMSRVIYDRPFGGVLPTYHRLDISIERVFTYREDSYVTVQVGAINLYDRTNLFALDVFTLRRVDQLPIIPTIGVKFEF